jgi:hypothetical protein
VDGQQHPPKNAVELVLGGAYGFLSAAINGIDGLEDVAKMIGGALLTTIVAHYAKKIITHIEEKFKPKNNPPDGRIDR